jgi:OFA family oxalate/formate antiporter-like MFS transporter
VLSQSWRRRRSGVDGNGPKRFSVQRKMAIAARLLRGEPLELVVRETNVSIARLTEWRDRALAGAAAALHRADRDRAASVQRRHLAAHEVEVAHAIEVSVLRNTSRAVAGAEFGAKIEADLGAAIGGIGAGVIYGASVGNALKWFPDRRGLAAGLTAAGFGAGSALTVIPIANMIQSSGYQAAFLWFGLGQGIVVALVALLLRAPQAGEVVAPAAPAVQQTRRDYGPTEVLKTPVFWVMYAMFVMVGAGGLMAIAQLAPIANDYKIAGIPVSILGLTLPALTFALTIDRVLNGICRPFFGWVSDHIGRENTMFIAFFVEGVGIYALLYFANNPVLFVILSGMVFFAWGEIYSLFPATCTDIYGRKFATTNYGMLYTAKGTASLLVPLANVLTNATGSWHAVFYVAAILNIVAAVMALVVLRPMRRRAMA